MTESIATSSHPKEERNWAMLCHLSSFLGYAFPFGNLLAPLFVWLFKREDWDLVDDQGKESLNFQISWTLYGIVAGILCIILIGFPLLAALWISHLALVIVASVGASEGKVYRYPGTIRFIQ